MVRGLPSKEVVVNQEPSIEEGNSVQKELSGSQVRLLCVPRTASHQCGRCLGNGGGVVEEEINGLAENLNL